MSRWILALVVACAWVGAGVSGAGQAPPLSADDIPSGVVLKKISRKALAAAAARVRAILAPGYAGKDRLFRNPLVCGPYDWKRLATEGTFGASDSFAVKFVIPLGDRTLAAEGRELRNRGELAALEAHLRQTLEEDGGFTVRAPRAHELDKYRGIVSHDLEEPLFILDSASHNFLIDLKAGAVIFFDDLQPPVIK